MKQSEATAHAGHDIFPHDHSAQVREKGSTLPPREPWCTGRWCCLTCAGKDLPRGVWFSGPQCKPGT